MLQGNVSSITLECFMLHMLCFICCLSHVSHVANRVFYLTHEIIIMLMLKVLCEFKNVNLLKYLKLCKNNFYSLKCALSYGVKVC
jgi:hypothetical protein